MNTGPDNSWRSPPDVAGIEPVTEDLLVTSTPEILRKLLAEQRLPTGVTLGAAPSRIDSLLERCPQTRSSGGGAVCNTLFGIGRARAAGEIDLSVAWVGAGPTGIASENPAILDELRVVCVRVHVAAPMVKPRRVVCMIDTHGEVHAIIVERPGPLPNLPWAVVGVPTVALATLEQLTEPGMVEALEEAESVAILTADAPPPTAEVWSRLAAWSRGRRLRWFLGSRREHGLLGTLRRLEELPGVEIVGTDGPKPVQVIEPGLAPRLLPVPEVPDASNPLGCGDAYAGAWLAARIQGEIVDTAHAAACRAAATVLRASTARAAPPVDLVRMFGERLRGRESERRDEGRLHATLHRGCGPVVVTCGQPGVDQAGLAAARELGLPPHAVMPRGRRTETVDAGGRDDLSAACVRELESPSYRYCTWANAYIGDGTILWDFRGSEGSAETRIACAALGRPLLEATAVPLERLVETAVRWASQHAVRVVHVAGNRLSGLDEATHDRVRREVREVLTALAFHHVQHPAGRPSAPVSGVRGRYGGLRLGVPNTNESRSLIARFLEAVCGVPPQPDSRVLLRRYPEAEIEVVFARVRDLPAMISRGVADAALMGSDILLEGRATADLETVLDTGLQPCLLALLQAHDADGAPTRLASQYPNISTEMARSEPTIKEIVPIGGAAEAWLATGCVDGVVDTWRTGATADANRMYIRRALASTWMVLAAPWSQTGSVREGVRALAADLDAWLGSGGTKVVRAP